MSQSVSVPVLPAAPMVKHSVDDLLDLITGRLVVALKEMAAAVLAFVIGKLPDEV